MPRHQLSRRLHLTGAAASFAALLAVGCGSDPAPRQAAAERPTKVADAGRILFSREVDGHFALFTIAPDGRAEQRITSLEGDAINGDWSPDGRRIVFEYDRPKEQGCKLMLVNADGSGLRDLSGPDADCDGQPAFTPDGGSVVFVHYDEAKDEETLRRMDLADGRVSVIGGRLGDTDPNVSPDGRTITFVRRPKEHERQALWAVDLDGTHTRRLTPDSFEVATKHAWSPDGTRIALTTNADWVRPDEGANVLTIAATGTRARTVTRYRGGETGGDNAFVGSFSPDGRRLVARVERNGKGALAVLNADGTGLREITPRSEDRPRFIDWGPGAAPRAVTPATLAAEGVQPRRSSTTAALPPGTYTTTIFASDPGADEGTIGEHRMVIADGELRIEDGLSHETGFDATFRVDGHRIVAEGGPDRVRARFSVRDGVLRFTDVKAPLPYRVVWGSHPWRLIAR